MTSRRAAPYKWEFRAPRVEQARLLAERWRLHTVVAQVLANRQVVDEPEALKDFMRPGLAMLHDPFLLKDMELAADEIAAAVRAGKKITIYGDYDADGITSTSLMLRLFRFLKADVDYYIPHRVEEGYGLNQASLDQIVARGTELIITVDTGISAVELVDHVQAKGIRMVITDHHQPGPAIPAAIAVVNPSRTDCTYPNPHLVGVGVAFKTAHAVLKKLGIPPADSQAFLRSVLDLVAVGSIADFAPLTGENRAMVHHGLLALDNRLSVGFAALMRLCKSDGRTGGELVGFQIAPRLNAAGRTSHADIAVELLTTDDPDKADRIARQLDEYNNDRRRLEADIFVRCTAALHDDPQYADEPILVLSGEDWHPGVVGIVASRVLEFAGKPVIVMCEKQGILKGSARSVEGLNIFEALTACRDCLIQFGGHPQAAGLALRKECLPQFRQLVNDYAREAMVGRSAQRSLLIDAEINCSGLDYALMDHLKFLEPHGNNNPSPLLAMRKVTMSGPPRIVGTNHLKIQLRQQGAPINGIGFNLGHFAGALNGAPQAEWDVAFKPMLNHFSGTPRVEIEVKDLRPHSIES